jgi:hypothetical protein
VHDEVALRHQLALEALDVLEGGEEAALAGAGVGEVTVPGVRPVAVVEALGDDVHVPAGGGAPVLEEAPDDLLGIGLLHDASWAGTGTCGWRSTGCAPRREGPHAPTDEFAAAASSNGR